MNKVECYSCGSDIIPRLVYHKVNSLLYNRSQDHVCSICGETMYSTGGGLSPLAMTGFYIGLFFLAALGLQEFANIISKKPILLIFTIPFILPVLYFVSRRYAKVYKVCLYVKKASKWSMVVIYTPIISMILVALMKNLMPFDLYDSLWIALFVVINVWLFYTTYKYLKDRNQMMKNY